MNAERMANKKKWEVEREKKKDINEAVYRCIIRHVYEPNQLRSANEESEAAPNCEKRKNERRTLKTTNISTLSFNRSLRAAWTHTQYFPLSMYVWIKTYGMRSHHGEEAIWRGFFFIYIPHC